MVRFCHVRGSRDHSNKACVQSGPIRVTVNLILPRAALFALHVTIRLPLLRFSRGAAVGRDPEEGEGSHLISPNCPATNQHTLLNLEVILSVRQRPQVWLEMVQFVSLTPGWFTGAGIGTSVGTRERSLGIDWFHPGKIPYRFDRLSDLPSLNTYLVKIGPVWNHIIFQAFQSLWFFSLCIPIN